MKMLTADITNILHGELLATVSLAGAEGRC